MKAMTGQPASPCEENYKSGSVRINLASVRIKHEILHTVRANETARDAIAFKGMLGIANDTFAAEILLQSADHKGCSR